MSFNGWREELLSSIVETVIDYRGKTPKKLGGDWSLEGYRALSAKNIKNGRIVQLDSIRYVNEDLYKKWMKEEVKRGDILITSEAPFGEVIYWNSDEKVVLSQRIFGLRCKQEYHSKFVYYYMTTHHFQSELRNRATGTTVTGLRQPELLKCPVYVPSLYEQKAIAATLSCLDDKIELNNRINKTLEEMAQAIFKNWFVDFEPFQDSEFKDSESGRIPKGWRVGYIDELIENTIGGDWGKENERGNYTEEVVCIRGADIPEIAMGKRGKTPVRFILKKNLEKKQLLKDQIIIEISGGSPTQSTGRTALITNELLQVYKNPLICTNFCRALSFKKKEYSTFVYSLMQYLYRKEVFFLYENGTTGIKNLDIGNLFGKHQIIIPDAIALKEYYELYHTILKSIYDNGFQTDKLSMIRDTLLSKLMSGEIRVPLEEVQ